MKIKSILTVSLFFCLYIVQAQSNSLITAFDAMDQALNNGAGYSNSHNLNIGGGNLAWGESYIMMSYLNMYRATGNKDYLHRFVMHAANVLNQRDDIYSAANPGDDSRKNYKGDANATWVRLICIKDSLVNNTKICIKDTTQALVVDNGMITYPMADFAQMVKNGSASLQQTVYTGNEEITWSNNPFNFQNKTFLQIADYLIDRVNATLNYFEGHWSNKDFYTRSNECEAKDIPGLFSDCRGTGCTFISPGGTETCGKSSLYRKNNPIPLNQMLTMGRTLLAMYLATNNSDHRDKVEGMANYFKDNLTLTNGHYEWHYAGDKGRFEDISHGAIDVDFARLCYEQGIVFTLIDMVLFSNTYLDKLHAYHGRFKNYVDGSDGGGEGKPFHRSNDGKWAASRWLSLTPFHPAVYRHAAHIDAEYIYCPDFSECGRCQSHFWCTNKSDNNTLLSNRHTRGASFLSLSTLVLYQSCYDIHVDNDLNVQNVRRSFFATGTLESDGSELTLQAQDTVYFVADRVKFGPGFRTNNSSFRARAVALDCISGSGMRSFPDLQASESNKAGGHQTDPAEQPDEADVCKVEEKEIQASKTIRLHPNPTPGHFTLQLPDYEGSGLSAHVSITDLTGRLIHRRKTTAQQLELDLTEQGAGMYMVKVQIGYRLFTEKVVKE